MQRQKHEQQKRHHPRGRLWHTPLPRDPSREQTAHAGVRQAHGVLPAEHADVRGHTLSAADQHTARHTALCRTIGRRQPVGHEHSIRCATQAGRPGAGLHHRARLCGRAANALVLGDNIFYGHELGKHLFSASQRPSGARVFAYHVHDPERYGVVTFDAKDRAINIEEKPAQPKSNYAVTGLYFYDEQVCDIAASIKPSQRGELEITDVNKRYLEQNQLSVEIMGRGYAWLDTGTHDSLLEAANFIATLQKHQGLQVACPEEIAYRQGWIDAAALHKPADPLKKNGYGQYLCSLIDANKI